MRFGHSEKILLSEESLPKRDGGEKKAVFFRKRKSLHEFYAPSSFGKRGIAHRGFCVLLSHGRKTQNPSLLGQPKNQFFELFYFLMQRNHWVKAEKKIRAKYTARAMLKYTFYHYYILIYPVLNLIHSTILKKYIYTLIYINNCLSFYTIYIYYKFQTQLIVVYMLILKK